MLHTLVAILAITHPPTDSLVPRMDTAYVQAQSREEFGNLGRYKQTWLNTGLSGQSMANFLAQNGVYLKQYGANGIATISRRGADPQQTQVLWNGIPLANSMLGMTDLNNQLIFGNNAISITDGGNASVYGSGSVGGTLMVNHGKPKDAGFGVANSTVWGSFGKFSNGIDLSYLSAKFWVRAQGFYSEIINNYFYSDLIQNEWKKIRMKNANATFINARLQAGFNLKKLSIMAVAEKNYSLRNMGMIIGSSANQGRQIDYANRIVIESKINWKNWSNINRIGITQEIILFKNGIETKFDSSRTETKHFQTEWYLKSNMGNLLFGADAQWQQGLVSAYAGQKNRFYPAQFVSAILAIKKWNINPGFRFEWYEKIPIGSLSFERNLFMGYRLKGNLHNTFRRPTLNDLFWGGKNNDFLKPEKGWGSELGIAGEKVHGKWRFDNEACFYFRNIHNTIVWLPQGQLWLPQNMFLGNYYGTQLKLKTNYFLINNKFEILIHYDWCFSNIYATKSAEAMQRIFIPQHSGNLKLSWEKENAQLNFNCTYTGKRFTSTDNANSLPAYWLISLQGATQLWKAKNTFAIIGFIFDNVANAQYFNMPAKPMPPRSFMFNLIIKYNSKK
jgi:iron complex outermembrane receptor protein